LRLRIQKSECGNLNSGFRILSLDIQEFGMQGLGLRSKGSAFRAQGLGLRV
jgi:hypothetical protein